MHKRWNKKREVERERERKREIACSRVAIEAIFNRQEGKARSFSGKRVADGAA